MAVLQGSVWRLTVLIGDGERWHRRPLFEEIVRRAQQRGMAGVTVLHGIEGFGAGGTQPVDKLGRDLHPVEPVADHRATTVDNDDALARALERNDVLEGRVISAQGGTTDLHHRGRGARAGDIRRHSASSAVSRVTCGT